VLCTCAGRSGIASDLRSARTPPGATRLGLGMPASAFLGDLPFLFERREHAVQVVLLDAHLCGQLGDRDPGLSLHERVGLRGARAAAFASAGFARRRGGGGGGSSSSSSSSSGRRCRRFRRFVFAAGRAPWFFGPFGPADFFGASWGATPFFGACARGGGFAGGARRTSRSTTARSSCRRGGRSTDSVEGRSGSHKPVVLVYQRSQLVQPGGDLSALLVKEIGHDPILIASANAFHIRGFRHLTPYPCGNLVR
jgi:hypothetical protein